MNRSVELLQWYNLHCPYEYDTSNQTNKRPLNKNMPIKWGALLIVILMIYIDKDRENGT